MKPLVCAAFLGLVVLGSAERPQADDEPAGFGRRVRFHAEVKAHFRSSDAEEFRLSFPFPPSFIPPGESAVFMRAVSPGNALELSNAALIAMADLSPHLAAKVRVHVLDLYNRNPTTSDDRIQLREAWVRLGRRFEGLQPIPGTSLYVLAGKAPRFTRQLERGLESYGLWGTALARFEETQLELGGSLGRSLYWRAQVASPNPLFFRDPNALAGDNGTPERVPGNVHPILQSGFPILYDAKSNEVTLVKDKFQLGAGLGVRAVSEDERKGVDLLGWYFRRDLADSTPIRGSFYSGDINLLQNFAALGIAFDVRGRRKVEYGANLEARFKSLHLFSQYVHQDIASLVRRGFEAELGCRIALNGVWLSGETPVLNWIEPVVRASKIDNDFFTPRNAPAPSVGWNWRKYDLGVRIGIVPEIDLTAEYSFNDAHLFSGAKLHPNELLLTLRAGF